MTQNNERMIALVQKVQGVNRKQAILFLRKLALAFLRTCSRERNTTMKA